MIGQHDKQRALCEKLRKLGYARARHVRLYGEDFHLISDPFPDGDGFVVEGIARRSGRSRVVRIPLSTVHTLQRELTFEAQSEIAA
jgi:hypothetical protein